MPTTKLYYGGWLAIPSSARGTQLRAWRRVRCRAGRRRSPPAKVCPPVTRRRGKDRRRAGFRGSTCQTQPGRPRKETLPVTAPAQPKRSRGRPRKVAPPPAAEVAPAVAPAPWRLIKKADLPTASRAQHQHLSRFIDPKCRGATPAAVSASAGRFARWRSASSAPGGDTRPGRPARRCVSQAEPRLRPAGEAGSPDG